MSACAVDEVLDLYERWGTAEYDEDVGQSAHALQTAALAVADGAHDGLVVAALLHDVGHLLVLQAGGRSDPEVDDVHETAGAAWLRPLFPASVTSPIALHVRAKRYLCGVDHSYLRSLSPASVTSLAVQGGPMTVAEAGSFEALPGCLGAVRLRHWDDAGKVAGADVPGWDAYVPLLERLAVASITSLV
jgi:gamma-butyrobetaine dioxygenase